MLIKTKNEMIWRMTIAFIISLRLTEMKKFMNTSPIIIEFIPIFMFSPTLTIVVYKVEFMSSCLGIAICEDFTKNSSSSLAVSFLFLSFLNL